MKNLRCKIVDLCYKSKEGHIPSALSILDILYVLYGRILKPEDYFVLSKGHGSLALYVVLNYYKQITDKELDSFCEYDSILGGHPDRNKIKSVNASTGSLGHGLPMSVGLALGSRLLFKQNRIYCLVGDQELNEGSCWESFLLINHHNLNNMTILVDYNKSGDRALTYNNLYDQIQSFGFDVYTCDGHNHSKIFSSLQEKNGKPTAIIFDTIKGYGVTRMENNPAWHHKFPSDVEYNEIIKELK